MSSIKPYLIRAVHQWAVDAGFTPHVVVDATVEGVAVPQAYVMNGQIVLNIHPQALSGLDIGNEWMLFSARFGGQPFEVALPMAAVMAVFAKENGQGISFPKEGDDGNDADEKSKAKGPVLRVVK